MTVDVPVRLLDYHRDAVGSLAGDRPSAAEVVATAFECALAGDDWRHPLRLLVRYLAADGARISKADAGPGCGILACVGATSAEAYDPVSPGLAVNRAPAAHLTVPIETQGCVPATLTVFRRPRTGPFDAGDSRQLAAVSAPFARAFRIAAPGARPSAAGDWRQDILDRLGFGVILVDEHLRVLDANGTARTLCAHAGTVRLADGKIRGGTAASHAELRRIVERALAGEREAAFMMLGASGAPRAAMLQLLPFAGSGSAAGAQLLGVIVPVDGKLDVEAARLQKAFALTRAEARLAARLVRGDTFDDAAEALGISVTTARTYAKRVFQKIGVHRQADLTRAVFPMALVDAAFAQVGEPVRGAGARDAVQHRGAPPPVRARAAAPVGFGDTVGQTGPGVGAARERGVPTT